MNSELFIKSEEENVRENDSTPRQTLHAVRTRFRTDACACGREASPRAPKTRVEACRSSDGQLLDYHTQRELTPAAKAKIASHIRKQFWMDVSGFSPTSEALTDGTSGDECTAAKEVKDILCCTFEVNEEGVLGRSQVHLLQRA
ncbi:hypothetical protein CEXT_715641 [Caerostris extrusa]|uniref:Uncharacterized protein n=1 Tax=Caerostris extrusa TaxID=172846 RepID=A0AAV4MMW0_CAEEX|nr:hypothetical protein CEXT_715641 [Caerostris extrusa]